MRVPRAVMVALLVAPLPGCGSRTGVLLGESADASSADGSEVVPDVYLPPPNDSGAPGTDAASCNAAPIVGEVPPSHRPAAVPCMPSGNPYGPDAGPVPCAADGGCPLLASTYYEPQCIGGLCLLRDQCTTDSDCTMGCAGSKLCACACSSDQRYTNGPLQPNLCVPRSCTVDGDCGPGSYCVMSLATGCTGSLEFRCTTAQDRCVDPAKDCAACTGKACVYGEQVGWWVCSGTTPAPCSG
jgi:hypothetical protein